MNIHQSGAVEVVAKLQSNEVDAQQLFEDQQARIQKLNNEFNAFVHVEKTPQATNVKGRLAGLPISVKDQIHVAGMPCASGYEPLKSHIPKADAPVIAALKAEGAQIAGKTNLPPMAMDFQTYNKLHGRTDNPWNSDYTVGGSSGGGAAAVAAGMSFVDIGADLAGSLRIPASFCGVCSLMPSVGRLPVEGTMTLLEQANVSLDYLPRVGPIARQVEDLSLIWQTLTNSAPGVKSEARIAILPEMSDMPLHPQIRKAMQTLEQHLIGQSQVRVETKAPAGFDWKQAWQAYGIIQGHQLGAMLNPLQRFITRLLSRGAMQRSPNFIRPIQDGYKRNEHVFIQAMETRQMLVNTLDAFLSSFDCWVLPVTLVPAFEHIEASYEKGFVRNYNVDFEYDGHQINYFEALTHLTIPFNLTGHPVVTIPVAKDEETGVPIGVQLVGKRNKEAELLATAELIMSLLPTWHDLEYAVAKCGITYNE